MGIYKETIRKYMIGHQMRQVVANNGVLDLDQFYLDATAVGATQEKALFEAELEALPDLVKNEAETILVPGIYKNGKVYGFNGSTKGLVEFNFSRAGSGTYWDKDRVMQIAPTGMPRISYNPENGFCNGYLFEDSSTNLVPDSTVTNLNNYNFIGVSKLSTGWNKGAPLASGIRFNDQTATNIYAYITYTLVVGKTYTFSVYVKMDDNSVPAFGSSAELSPLNDFVFYLNKGTDPTQYKVEYCGSNIYRVSVTLTVTESQVSSVGVTQRPQNSRKPFVVTGYQLEEASVASSYIPTTGSAGVRADDMLASALDLFVAPGASLFSSHIIAMSPGVLQSFLYRGSSTGRFCTPANTDATKKYRMYDGTNLLEATEGSFVNGSRSRYSASFGSGGLKMKTTASALVSGVYDGVFGEPGAFTVFTPYSGAARSSITLKQLATFTKQLSDIEHNTI